MAKPGIEIVGSPALTRALQTAAARGPQVLTSALYEEALDIFAVSQRMVPHDEGTLEASGGVEIGDREITIGYGGAASAYALAVHETEKNYKNGRSWKYLETPFFNAQDGMANRLAARILRYLEGGE